MVVAQAGAHGPAAQPNQVLREHRLFAVLRAIEEIKCEWRAGIKLCWIRNGVI
jgi:hypothetical protein